ncbi:hypothetical protein [Chryseobacterium sp. JK1]|uniref:hypothetical protein n=1 Tax=Chryseobacterium sp. JK1 TaxID=874294 RepID=UPI003D686763
MNKYFGLLKKVRKKVKQEHEDLHDRFLIVCKHVLINFLSDRNSYFFIPIIVIGLFCAPLVLDFEVLKVFDFNIETVKVLVDQRTTNIATIISISLVVVGFLINNLAVKSPTTYKLLFKKSLLYFTIYLTLSTIFFFIILSTLRDSFAEVIYIKLVLAGTYISLFILILIGMLFRQIIYFTNEKEISNMLFKELMKEGKVRMKIILMKKYSPELYQSFMEERGINLIERRIDLATLQNSRMILSGDVLEIDNNKDVRYLRNINLWLLNIILKLKIIDGYDSLSLDDAVNLKTVQHLRITNKKNLPIKLWLLRMCYSTGKKPCFEYVSDVYRKEFDSKIIQLAEENKYRNLADPLKAYLELYKIQMLNK